MRIFAIFATLSIGIYSFQISSLQGQELTASLDVPKSISTFNFGAITPNGAIENWPEYIYAWPGLSYSRSAPDNYGNYIPAFDTRAQGVGLWWYWLNERTNLKSQQRTSLREVATKIAGFSNHNHPSVRNYLKAYRHYWKVYSGRKIGDTDAISLESPDQVEVLAQVMFHHEAGRNAGVSKLDLMEGIALADMLRGRANTFAITTDWHLAGMIKQKPRVFR